jgi:signal transduction histidine kinase
MKSMSLINRKVQLELGSVILILLVLGAISYRAMVVSTESELWAQHSHAVFENLQDLLFAMESIESSCREFVLTGSESYFESYGVSISIAKQDESALRSLTVDSPQQQRQLPALEKLVAQKVEFAETVSSLRRDQGFAAADQMLNQGEGVRLMNALRKLTKGMEAEEIGSLAARTAAHEASASRARLVMRLGWLMALGLLIAASRVVYQDIAERARAKAEIEKLNCTLSKRMAELEAANNELEAFTYSVSHDLRAPLRHISGFSKILLEEYGPQLDPTAQHYLQRVSNATTNMGLLVDGLLKLSRLGRRELDRQLTGLNSLVDDVLVNRRQEMEGRNIEWRIDQLPCVDCDPTLMKQVFDNLLANAIKFTRPRQPAVIQVGQTMLAGETVVYVRDNGVGFSMKYAGKLFGVFQRLHRAEDFEGTGVGLATVQRIIHKHGGRIWAEAELDKGATFYFTLGPVSQRDEQPQEQPMTPALAIGDV